MTEAIDRDPPVRRLRWHHSIRLISARYPPVRAFEDTVLPADLDVVLEVLAVTDPDARAAAGDLSLVPATERVSGPGSSPVMAAFTHPNPSGSRFAGARHGVYYAARRLETALAETRFHQQRILGMTAVASTSVVLNVYEASIDTSLHDVRDAEADFPEAYVTDTADYPRSQSLAQRLREKGSSGIAYDSVRDTGGQCVALFRPGAIGLPVRHDGQVTYHWDGKRQAIVDTLVERDIASSGTVPPGA